MNRSPRSHRLSTVAVLVAVGVASAACVQPGPPTVGMSKVEASLVFGLTDVPKPVPSPVEQVAQLLAPPPAAEADQEEEPEFQFAKPFVPRFAPQEGIAPTEECPEASISAAPEVAPQPRISGEVRQGKSDWRIQVIRTAKNADGTKTTDASPELTVPRIVQNVKKSSNTLYTFEEIVPNGLDNTVRVRTYEVNTSAINRNPSDGVGIVVTPGVGEPERGITLIREDIQNGQTGQSIRTFAPAGAGLLMLPLPVVAGERFASTATDPRTGETRTHEALVLERQRVDACGDLIDGWGVRYERRESTSAVGTAITTAANFAITHTSVFATQYGGVPILENFSLKEGQCEFCPFEFKQRLGQLNPTPPTPAP